MEKYLAIIQSNEKIGVVINTCFGGFGLSKEGVDEYNKRSGKNLESWDTLLLDRHDPDLVAMVRDMGGKELVINGQFSSLSVDKIPIYMQDFYSIKEYDGQEYIRLLEDKFKISQIKLINNDDSLSHQDKKTLIDQIIQFKIPDIEYQSH